MPYHKHVMINSWRMLSSDHTGPVTAMTCQNLHYTFKLLEVGQLWLVRALSYSYNLHGSLAVVWLKWSVREAGSVELSGHNSYIVYPLGTLKTHVYKKIMHLMTLPTRSWPSTSCSNYGWYLEIKSIIFEPNFTV